MERGRCLVINGEEQDEAMDLPPGFRFHPTDEELVTHYLGKKAMDQSFRARAIAEVDLNKCEPWDLPWRAKMGEKEWYFFCVRDRKYPTGLRTNRATEAGYWKATGKDKEIYKGKSLVGMKKTLVFYTGRAPRGEKTNWVMHEYRLEGRNKEYSLCKAAAKNEWVICRVFHKPPCVKKAFGLPNSIGDELGASPLPPLMDSPSANGAEGFASASASEVAHVTCFSNAMESYFNSPAFSFPASTLPLTSLFSTGTPFPTTTTTNFGKLKAEREVGSVSQETGLTTTDMNTEISSVFSSNCDNVGKQGFDGGETETPSAALPPLPGVTLDDYGLWDY